ncbi:hypothetical protein FIBSPDRAFT_876355 [Athelia psychrophila]|uniref:Uncharacterized protein n=1 Tax=Athelia psychrophila TaxID=1759441 RepID=A0A167WYR2_9AGAM|nr:hypothetical protein FIBSPDRAFT_876355 [Fibularhizoctonia sp. CBS 109695]
MQLPTYDPAALAGIVATHTQARCCSRRGTWARSRRASSRPPHLCPSTRERRGRAVVA